MKKRDKWTCALFCGFLGVMFLLFLLLPREDFSQKEKRYLAEKPEAERESILSGRFGEELESYVDDHMPGRDFFVGLNAYYELLTGTQISQKVCVAAGDRLMEPPPVWNPAAVEKNMAAINAFAETVGQRVDLMLVPSAGFILEDSIRGLHDPYEDDAAIREIYDQAGENVTCLDLTEQFLGMPGKKDLYYRTDHHWTSLGSYTAYRFYMEQAGREALPPEAFTVETIPDFHGSTYSRSGLWLTRGEPLEIWDTGGRFTVTNEETETPHAGLFYRERLEELDKYTVFLDGNHSLVRIENPDALGKGKLLAIRDSFSNCLGTFLANNYETVVLADLRYYKQPLSELVQEEGFTDILVCYSIGNFLTDPNLVWLR